MVDEFFSGDFEVNVDARRQLPEDESVKSPKTAAAKDNSAAEFISDGRCYFGT